MKYQEMQQLEKILKMQLDMLHIMENFIKFDEEYEKNHPEEKLPPIVNSGVLKSHFITQKKACEGFLSYTARHLPRMKKEYDLGNKTKIDTNKKEVVKVDNLTQNQNKTKIENRTDIVNPQIGNPQFISLF